MPPIVLASGSIYRRQLLAKLCLTFEWASPDIDESAMNGEQPEELVARLARQKTEALTDSHPNHLIIGSDQVASLNGRMLTKPGSRERAIEQLQACSGHKVAFYTGLCLLNSATQSTQLCVEPFTVEFRELKLPTIERYIDKELPLDCAGSFKCEGLGITLFKRLIGDDPNSLVGLPLIRLTDMLHNEGIELP